jgi:hypothetical protein
VVCGAALFACGNTKLHGDGGSLGDPCTGDQTRCQGSVFQVCVDGFFTTRMDCASDALQCDAMAGCVACTPGQTVCDGNAVRVCESDGTLGSVVQTCLGSCVAGTCPDPCSQAIANRSYIGCEYWPVDLDNAVEVLLQSSGTPCTQAGSVPVQANVCTQGAVPFPQGLCDYGNDCSAAGAGFMCQLETVCALDAQHSPFAIVVANPDGESQVEVTLQNGMGMSQMVAVPPRAVVPIFPQMLGFPDQSLDFSAIEKKAYKLTSSRPIVAYQFNPLNDVRVFSNDASLLIPAHAYDTTYIALDWPTLTRRPTAHDYSAYVTVVASSPDVTHVTVESTARIRRGLNVAAFGPGMMQFELHQFETLNLEAMGGPAPNMPGDDLTGTKITSDKPVGVFVGHEATNLSQTQPSPCCADHLEDQLFPVSTWGKKFAIARAKQRASEPDLLRILALRAGTTIAFNPTTAGTCPPLAAGGKCDVFITGDVEVTASDAVLIGHFLLSTGGIAPDSGDPSLSYAVPTEQFRKTYTFLVPMAYNFNYVSLVAQGGVRMDGTDVTGMLASFGTGTFKGGRLALQAGPHEIDCPGGCGIEVYGWSDAVSYMFAGGLDLKQIVVP